ncbi:TDP-N-acetylfucosamine:lipid II N-acetylfucosaminyltransferase [compost metagenome]
MQKNKKMKKLKILHLANDEKFIDQAIKTFERAAPGANDLYVHGRKPLKFVRSPAETPSIANILRGRILKNFSEYNAVMVHSLNPIWYSTILKLPKDIPVTWLGWGYDYYDIIYNSIDEMLLPLTRAELKEKIPQRNFLKSIKLLIRKAFFEKKKSKVIRRLNFFSPVLPAEYQMVSDKYSENVFPEYIPWNYGNLEEDFIKSFTDTQVTGDSILVGNSASVENNHIDSFSLLLKIGISDRKIITPLSYGDTRYRDLIIIKGRELLGELFEPLTDFMPINEYVRTLNSCGFAVMNHVRQQAVGNIVIMLYLGAKVFLRRECPTYSHFRDQGIVIFSIQELEENPDLLSERLDRESMEINREIIKRSWSKEVSDKRTEDLLRKACKAS